MEVANYNRRITIQDLSKKVWASIGAIGDRNKDLADLTSHSSGNFYRIKMRYRKDVEIDMRITDGSTSYDVKKVYDADGKRRELVLICEECIVFNQSVVIELSAGGIDDWGNPIERVTITLPCRFDETIKTVRNRNGEEVISFGRFIFDGLADIKPTTVLEFDGGSYYPVAIEKRRGTSGKVLVTVVNVQ